MNAILRRQVLRFGLAAVMALFSATHVNAGPAVPAACQIKTQIDPPEPGWAYVVNFEAFEDPTSPLGCLIVWRVPHFRPTDYVVTTCKTQGPANGVVYTSDGRAQFNGGYVTCDMNVKQMLNGLQPPVLTVDVMFYEYFTIIAPGQLSQRPQGAVGFNPIAHYQPANPEEPDASLYVSVGPNGGVISTTSNNEVRTGKFLNESILNTRQPFTFAVGFSTPVASPIVTATHYLTSTPIDEFPNQLPVRFWANGGTLWIGASSTFPTARMAGVFDEVILDPPDGGAPPPPSSLGVRYYELYMPLSQFNPP
jgi:hypothetical protein